MRILIIRHGDPDYVADSLTEKGWREAELLGERIALERPADVYASPLGRALDTSKAACDRLGKAPVVLPWLREFHGTVVGPFEERRRIPWNLMPRYWMGEPLFFDKDRWMDAPIMRTGDVYEVYRKATEGFDALLARYGYVRDGCLYRCERNLGITIALFCHFGLGLALLAHVAGLALPLVWQSFFLPTSSVTTLRTEERVRGEVFFKCVSVGDTSHLYAGGEPVSDAGLFPEILAGPGA